GAARAGETRLRRSTGKTRTLQGGVATAGRGDRAVRGAAARATERVEFPTQPGARGADPLGLGLPGGAIGRFGAVGAEVGVAVRQGREGAGEPAAARPAVPRHGGVESGGGPPRAGPSEGGGQGSQKLGGAHDGSHQAIQYARHALLLLP